MFGDAFEEGGNDLNGSFEDIRYDLILDEIIIFYIHERLLTICLSTII